MDVLVFVSSFLPVKNKFHLAVLVRQHNIQILLLLLMCMIAVTLEVIRTTATTLASYTSFLITVGIVVRIVHGEINTIEEGLLNNELC